jgi:hypothetical protein
MQEVTSHGSLFPERKSQMTCGAICCENGAIYGYRQIKD